MARLQKKKPAGQKRKKQSHEESGAGAQGAQAAKVKGTPAARVAALAKQSDRKKSTPKLPGLPGKKQVLGGRGVAAKKQPNFLDRSRQFLRETKVELKKVTWPTRQQTLGSTVVVIILVLLIAAFLGLVDMLLSTLVRMVLG